MPNKCLLSYGYEELLLLCWQDSFEATLSFYFQPLCQAKDPQPPLAPNLSLCSSDHGFLSPLCARLYLYDDIKSLSKSSEFSIMSPILQMWKLRLRLVE